MCCECFFCKDKRFELNNELGLGDQEWVLYEDDSVFVTSDIAPVLKGHFLIVSNEHINSFANGNKNIFESLIKAEEYLKTEIYKSENVLFFEHGAVLPHTAGGCIDHAHMHAIPLSDNINIDEFLKRYDLLDTPEVPMTYDNLKQFAEKQEPYISYTIKNESIIRSAYKLPSQFFRLLVSTYYPKEYNWKLEYKTEISKKLLLDTLHMR